MADDDYRNKESIRLLKEIVKTSLRKKHGLEYPKKIIMDFSTGSCTSYEEARSMLSGLYKGIFDEFLNEMEKIKFINLT